MWHATCTFTCVLYHHPYVGDDDKCNIRKVQSSIFRTTPTQTQPHTMTIRESKLEHHVSEELQYSLRIGDVLHS